MLIKLFGMCHARVFANCIYWIIFAQHRNVQCHCMNSLKMQKDSIPLHFVCSQRVSGQLNSNNLANASNKLVYWSGQPASLHSSSSKQFRIDWSNFYNAKHSNICYNFIASSSPFVSHLFSKFEIIHCTPIPLPPSLILNYYQHVLHSTIN